MSAVACRRWPVRFHPRRGIRSRRGLTLIETLLALTILGTGLSILVTGAARALTIARIAQHYSNAQFLLSSIDLEIPVATPYELYESPESGDFNPPYDIYRWTRTAEYFGPEEDQLFLIRTRVTWSDRGEDTFEETVTLARDRDAPVEAGARDTAESAAASGGAAMAAGATGNREPRPGMRVRSVTSEPRSMDRAAGRGMRQPGSRGAGESVRGGNESAMKSGASNRRGVEGSAPRTGTPTGGTSGSSWRRSSTRGNTR